jgi:SAM-dependent methyltransferase
MTYVTPTETPWLGGYTPGGDPATYYPDLWANVVKTLNVRSVLDVGCGEGHSLAYFRQLGCQVTGIEGTPQSDPDILRHDFTERAWSGPAVDLSWCCEFVEHIEERFIPNYLPALACAKVVMMTHADPGQPGFHHVNCRTADYWIGVMAAVGKHLDPALTEQSRMWASANDSPWNHYVRSGMVFR